MKWMLLITLVAAAPLFGASSTTTTTSSALSELALPSNTRQPLKLLERTAQFIAHNSYDVDCGRNLWPQGLPQELKELLDKTYWKTATNIKTFDLSEPISSSVLSPNSQFICSVPAHESTYCIKNAFTGELIARLSCPEGSAINSVNFSSDSRLVCSISNDNAIRVYDVKTGSLLHTLIGHTDVVYSAKFSSSNFEICTASKDGTVRVWNLLGEKLPRTISAETNPIHFAEFSPSGNKISLISSNGDVRIHDLVTGNLLHTLRNHHNFITTVLFTKFSPDESTILSVSANGRVLVWNTNTGKLLAKLISFTNTNNSIQFSPNSKAICFISKEGNAQLIESQNGELIAELSIPSALTHSVKFSPDGSKICMVFDNNNLCVWDVFTKNLLIKFTGHKNRIFNTSFSDDGNTIFSSSADFTIKAWGHEQLLEKHEAIQALTNRINAQIQNPALAYGEKLYSEMNIEHALAIQPSYLKTIALKAKNWLLMLSNS